VVGHNVQGDCKINVRPISCTAFNNVVIARLCYCVKTMKSKKKKTKGKKEILKLYFAVDTLFVI